MSFWTTLSPNKNRRHPPPGPTAAPPTQQQQQQQQQQYGGYYDRGSEDEDNFSDSDSYEEGVYDDADHHRPRKAPEEYRLGDSDEEYETEPHQPPPPPPPPPPTQHVFQHRVSPPPATYGNAKGNKSTGPAPPPSFPGLHEIGDEEQEQEQEQEQNEEEVHHQHKVALGHLSRRRPLDPVFRAPEGTFPVMQSSGPMSPVQGNIQIFVPTSNQSQSQDEAGEDEAVQDSNNAIDDADDDDKSSSSINESDTEESNQVADPWTEDQTMEEEYQWVDNAESSDESVIEETAAYPVDSPVAAVPERATLRGPDIVPPPTIARDTVIPPPPPPRDPLTTLQEDLSEDDKETEQESSPGKVPATSYSSSSSSSVDGVDVDVDFDQPQQSLFVLETPDRPIRPSKFVFLSDQKTVPTDLKRLQVTTMKRRRDLTTRMHDLDCQLAQLMSQYAEETMDLNLAIRDTVGRSICHPLEASVERLVMERESSAARGPAILQVERQLAELDALMTRHIHVTLSDAKKEELDGLQNDLYQDLVPGLRLEDSKSDKIEGGIIRRFETVAGIVAHQFHKESAARRGALETLQRRFQAKAAEDARQGDTILSTIQELRRAVQQERLDRMAADKRIKDEMIHTIVSMKRALLAAVAGVN